MNITQILQKIDNALDDTTSFEDWLMTLSESEYLEFQANRYKNMRGMNNA